MYLKIENETITYPIWDIRSEFPEVSLPEIITQDNLPHGYYIVSRTNQPTISRNQTIIETTPIWVDDHYEQAWEISPILYTLNDRLQIFLNIKSQAHELLEKFARDRGYFNLLSACSYINSNNDTYRSDAIECITKRDEMWMIISSIQTKIENNERDMIYDISEIIDELPSLVWE